MFFVQTGMYHIMTSWNDLVASYSMVLRGQWDTVQCIPDSECDCSSFFSFRSDCIFSFNPRLMECPWTIWNKPVLVLFKIMVQPQDDHMFVSNRINDNGWGDIFYCLKVDICIHILYNNRTWTNTEEGSTANSFCSWILDCSFFGSNSWDFIRFQFTHRFFAVVPVVLNHWGNHSTDFRYLLGFLSSCMEKLGFLQKKWLDKELRRMTAILESSQEIDSCLRGTSSVHSRLDGRYTLFFKILSSSFMSDMILTMYFIYHTRIQNFCKFCTLSNLDLDVWDVGFSLELLLVFQSC